MSCWCCEDVKKKFFPAFHRVYIVFLARSIDGREKICLFVCLSVRRQGPRTPKGGCTGVLVPEMEGRGPFFYFGRLAAYTPQKYAQSTQLVERITMGAFSFLKKIDFVRFFYFFVKKTLFVDEKSTFIIIITFHQITHQLVLSIFTWDFIFSSKFSL